MEEEFEVFWKSYPRRNGPKSKHRARLSFVSAIKRGGKAIEIISGARRYCEWCDQNQKTGTEFVAMPSTWLNQRRWEDYEMLDEARQKKIDDIATRHGYIWNGEKYVKTTEA